MSGRRAALLGAVAVLLAFAAALAVESNRQTRLDVETANRVGRAWDRILRVCDRREPAPTDKDLRGARAALSTILAVYGLDPDAHGEFGIGASDWPVSRVVERIASPYGSQHPECGELERRAAQALSR